MSSVILVQGRLRSETQTGGSLLQPKIPVGGIDKHRIGHNGMSVPPGEFLIVREFRRRKTVLSNPGNRIRRLGLVIAIMIERNEWADGLGAIVQTARIRGIAEDVIVGRYFALIIPSEGVFQVKMIAYIIGDVHRIAWQRFPL